MLVYIRHNVFSFPTFLVVDANCGSVLPSIEELMPLTESNFFSHFNHNMARSKVYSSNICLGG